MSEVQTTSNETEEVIDTIEVVHSGQCPSISERSNLTYSIGRDTQDGTLHLRVVHNDGGGMFYNGWASSKAIMALVTAHNDALTSKVFRELHPGRSVNTAGFVLASLKHLGLIRVHGENTRLHEHVPSTTFDGVALAAMGSTASTATQGSKATRVKKKEAA